MQPRTLNPKKRYDETFGDTRHRYLQDGVWFDAQGKESGVLCTDGSSRDHPEGGFDEAIAKLSLRNQSSKGPSAHVADMSDEDLALELERRKALRAARSGAPAAERLEKLEAGELDQPPPEAAAAEQQAQMRADLDAMPYARVKKFAIAAGAPQELIDAGGEGVKQKLVDWMVENHAKEVQVVGTQPAT